MCGRFSLRMNRDEIQEDVGVDEWINEEEYIPRYNIAPRTQAPVIRRRERNRDPSAGLSSSGNSNDDDGGLVMQTMKWGLVPHWSKFEDKTLSTTNARSENLVEGGGMWSSIKGKKRCAVPCQGYYEWLTKGKHKLPHFTKRKDGKLLLMAGLYDSVVLEGKTLWTFTIVTTDANKEFSWLHERQPVLLTTKDALDRWLDTSSQTWTPELTKMVQPYHDENTPLECYQVPKEVGKVGTESPSFIEPITNRKDGIEAMFSKQRQKNSSAPSSPAKSSGRKRTFEDSQSPAGEDAFTKPVTSTPSAKEGSSLPLSKKLKIDTEDESNQPSGAVEEALVHDINTEPKTDGKLSREPRSSPTKRKNVKMAPLGNKKIDSFFGKA